MRIPPRIKDLPAFDELLPLVNSEAPAGQRAAWSVKWVTREGVVKPDDWATLDDMKALELMIELQDVAARGDREAEQLTGNFTRGAVIKFLRKAREHYPEYIYAGNPPEGAYMTKTRPGWGEVKVKSLWRAI